MKKLRVYNDQNPNEILFSSDINKDIRSQLSDLGIRFEQWEASLDIGADTSNEEILKAYDKDIQKLKAQEGYQTVDVISLFSDNPQKHEFRKKFLSEHTHSEDEVRFFVRGEGLFFLHTQDKVCIVRCEQGDLISVPANMTHWFDMGENPNFTCIRLFNNPEGWVAKYSGSEIADQFPKFV